MTEIAFIETWSWICLGKALQWFPQWDPLTQTTNACCPGLLSDVVIKHYNQKPLEEQSIGWADTSQLQSLTQGSQGRLLKAGTQTLTRQESVLQACSPRFAWLAFFYTICPGIIAPTAGYILPHQLSIDKMSSPRPIQWEHFLSWGFLFSDESSFLWG